MAQRDPRTSEGAFRASVKEAVQGGRATPLFQPIVCLATGACRGFEALARLELGGELVVPDAFLPLLDDDDRLALFGAMLRESVGLVRSLGPAGAGLYVSINVEISLVASDDFVDVLHYLLDRHDVSGEALVLEILENEDIADLARLRESLLKVKALGLKLALDDVGTGYASMARMRELPIDMVKLDRGFVRGLEARPHELSFVMSMMTLARGIGKALVVEGVETAEVHDALRVLGIEIGQGYGIARPMPAAAVAAWLAACQPRRLGERIPACLLGAYASHLTVIETCRHMRAQPLPVAWRPEALSDHHGCAVGRLFGARGWHHTGFGRAHARFHEVLDLYATDPSVWEESSERFREAMAQALAADPEAMGCAPRDVGDRRPTSAPAAGRPMSRAAASAPRAGRR